MHIHEATNLCTSLGPSKVDKIAIHQAGDYEASTKRVRVILNPHRKRLMWQSFGDDPAVDDILSGICRLDYGTDRGLNPARLFVLLSAAERISSELIEGCMNLAPAQARRYMAASRLAVFHISRHFTNHPQEETDE